MAYNPRMADAKAEALDWLSTFEGACRGRDFATGRRLFAPDAVAFGTYATAVHGLDNIEREQWRQIWPRIRGFHIEGTPTVVAADASAWIAAVWASEATAADGSPFTRHGRATFVLARRDGRWLAVHSHVSLLPTQSESAHGRPA
jgi:ketosteroid isomerase-like protein